MRPITAVLILATLSALLAIVVAVWWDYTTVCADCQSSLHLDNVYRLLGEEGGIAGLTFFAGSMVGLTFGRRVRKEENG
jgi:hypothetical protein